MYANKPVHTDVNIKETRYPVFDVPNVVSASEPTQQDKIDNDKKTCFRQPLKLTTEETYTNRAQYHLDPTNRLPTSGMDSQYNSYGELEHIGPANTSYREFLNQADIQHQIMEHYGDTGIVPDHNMGVLVYSIPKSIVDTRPAIKLSDTTMKQHANCIKNKNGTQPCTTQKVSLVGIYNPTTDKETDLVNITEPISDALQCLRSRNNQEQINHSPDHHIENRISKMEQYTSNMKPYVSISAYNQVLIKHEYESDNIKKIYHDTNNICSQVASKCIVNQSPLKDIRCFMNDTSKFPVSVAMSKIFKNHHSDPIVVPHIRKWLEEIDIFDEYYHRFETLCMERLVTGTVEAPTINTPVGSLYPLIHALYKPVDTDPEAFYNTVESDEASREVCRYIRDIFPSINFQTCNIGQLEHVFYQCRHFITQRFILMFPQFTECCSNKEGYCHFNQHHALTLLDANLTEIIQTHLSNFKIRRSYYCICVYAQLLIHVLKRNQTPLNIILAVEESLALEYTIHKRHDDPINPLEL